MMSGPYPLVKDVVLVGGGHSHALLLRAWGMNPVAGARLTVINPAPSAPYTGMLPGHVAGHYDRDALEIDLVRLARHAGARLILGLVKEIDRTAQSLKIEGRPNIRYDIASIDIGITSEMPDIPGFDAHGVSAKPLGPFAEKWASFLERKSDTPVCVIGGGVAGVELALAMDYQLKSAARRAPVTIIEAQTALQGLSPRAQNKLRSALSESGIALLENAEVTNISAAGVSLGDGTQIDAGLVVGAAGARPFDWLKDTGLHLTDGYITVDRFLRSANDPNIYAAGDCAHIRHAPRPKAGVFAVRAAPILTHNIRADLTGGPRKPFQPQSSYLKLISLGRQSALTDKWGFALAGDWVWRWKDRIDTAFMDRLSNLPPMTSPAPKYVAKGAAENHEIPLCGGCGAKVGGGVLNSAIARHVPKSADAEMDPGDDAAILNVGGQKQVISTDHLRAFWDDPYLMARIAAVHALGDVWAMGAAPQSMLAQIILPRMDARRQSGWLDEVMAGAAEIATAAGARIVGGHTSMGAEMTIGFTVTGLLSRPAKTLGGANEGEVLVLTRPIGTGTLLAAEMAGRARGRDVTDALALMGTPQGDVAEILAPAATAMTDVTGFGLAGHAARMADMSGLTAAIDISTVPFLDGALDLARDGIRSTLYESNRADISHSVPESPESALLFDPQTAGGFLAALPERDQSSTVQALQDQGHNVSVIGRFEARSDVAFKAS